MKTPAISKRRQFRTPKPKPPVIAMAKLICPMVLKRTYGIQRVNYRKEDLELLRNLRNERVLLTPNHPTTAEPAIMFHLSAQVRESFYYVANRESFNEWRGLFGWILQSCGGYSVMRGVPDRESFRTTRKLMSESSSKLVIFPEGEVYSQNDSLLPFQSGVFQLMFFALEDMQKEGISAPLYVLPVAIKYKLLDDMSGEISEAMLVLERALGLDAYAGDAYSRLRRIGDAVLTSAETAYDLQHGSIEDLEPRMQAVKEAMLARVAEAVGLARDVLKGTVPEQMRTLINMVTAVTRDDDVRETFYEVRLRMEEQRRLRPMLQDLRRLANWLAVRDGYVAEKPTQERFAETLRRLEIEVFGVARIGGRKECLVKLGAPLDLAERFDAYQISKKETVAIVTSEVEGQVASLLV